MSRVLVTGGSGFIGSHLVETLLARGSQVRCLVRARSKVDLLHKWGAELAIGDVNEPESLVAALEGVQEVYHLAGLTKSLGTAELFRVNRDGTENLARACADRPHPPRVVMVSSIAAAGPAPRGQVRIEADPPAPVSYYGKSKLAAEEALALYADRVPATILRPGIVFGPRDTAMARAFSAIRLSCLHFAPGMFPPPLSFLYVTDLVELILRAAERGARLPAKENGQPGRGLYFATCPEFPTYADFGKMVRPLLNRRLALVLPLPGPLAWALAGFGEVLGRIRRQPDEVNFDKIREALASSWACSGEAARRELDFSPPLPLVERFRETIEWYRAEGIL